jgi:hypothetical protein
VCAYGYGESYDNGRRDFSEMTEVQTNRYHPQRKKNYFEEHSRNHKKQEKNEMEWLYLVNQTWSGLSGKV